MCNHDSYEIYRNMGIRFADEVEGEDNVVRKPEKERSTATASWELNPGLEIELGVDYRWDVQRARLLLLQNPRPVVCMNITEDLIGMACWIADYDPVVDNLTQKDYDQMNPVVVTLTLMDSGLFYIPIDGWNRIKSLHKSGFDKFPVAFLSREESDACMI